MVAPTALVSETDGGCDLARLERRAYRASPSSSSQFWTSRPRTRENPLMFRVISTRLRAFACPAMSTSYGPIGVPAAVLMAV